MQSDSVKYVLQNLATRKLRSGLTMLSILIGIAAIFTLVSFGLGIQKYVSTLAEDAGADKLFIQAKSAGAPGMDQNFYLREEDANFIGKIKGVRDIFGMYAQVGEISDGRERIYTFVMGMEPEEWILKTLGISVMEGRFPKTGETDRVVMGYNYQVAGKIFDDPLALGDKIELNGKKIEIVGFFSEVGNPQDDSQAYLTKEGLEQLYPDAKGKYGFFILRAEPGEDTEDLATRITDKLRRFKGQDKGREDFYVQTFGDILATFTVVIGMINGVLVLIALISLIVASVNIVNTMYTAVLERTKEIGIMKAIGARNSYILLVFMLESGLLGLLGGAVGVTLGYIAARTGGGIAASSGYSLLQPVFPWYLVLGCLLFGFGVGAISGILPARSAAQQRPVEALRYE